jgi:hypothetical protein
MNCLSESVLIKTKTLSGTVMCADRTATIAVHEVYKCADKTEKRADKTKRKTLK